MTGYATSAQALELLAEDWKETYEIRAEEVQTLARADAFFTKLLAGSTIFSAYNAIKVTIEGNIPWWAGGILGAMASVTTYLSVEAHRSARVNNGIEGEIEKIVADWEHRDQLHPIKIIQPPNKPNDLIINRWVGEHGEHAKPLSAYNTVQQLMANTDEGKFGLVNGVAVKHLGELIEIPQEGPKRTLHAGLNVPELGLQFGGIFSTPIERILLIGHNNNGQYCHHHILPAVETDTYYNNRRRKTQPAEAAKRLLWAPAPART